MTRALGEAQRARFEFGESGKPRRYSRFPASSTVRVYAAGAIFSVEQAETADGEGHYDRLDPWRELIFGEAYIDGSYKGGTYKYPPTGRFTYAGPSVVQTHGCAEESLASTCLAEVAAGDTLFAWIDREKTIGTLVEIGAAYATKKPVFVAFADEALAELFYFAKQLATVAVIAADVKAAWDLFVRWQTNN